MGITGSTGFRRLRCETKGAECWPGLHSTKCQVSVVFLSAPAILPANARGSTWCSRFESCSRVPTRESLANSCRREEQPAANARRNYIEAFLRPFCRRRFVEERGIEDVRPHL